MTTQAEQPSMFKRAYARGANDELIRLGHIRYPSKTAADEVADAVGDAMPMDPGAGGDVPQEVAVEVATTLVDAANMLVETAGGGGAPPEGIPPGMEGAEAAAPPPEAAAQMEEAAKESSAADIETRATNAASALMQKAAAQTKQALGSTIEGGDKGNEMGQAPAAETKMEAKNRPQGKHVVGVGNTAHPVGQGNVGTEQVPAPEAPAESPSGSNSNIQQSKLGEVLKGIVQKHAMGSTIQGGDKGNKLDQAAGVTGEAALENNLRPQGTHVTGVGNTEMPPGQGVIGSEQPHNIPPGESPSGSLPSGGGGNSVVDFSSSNKESADNAYVQVFTLTAQKVAKHLPNNMAEDEKIAQIRHMMGYNDQEIVEHIGMLHKQAGATDDQAVTAAEGAAKTASSSRKTYAGPGSTRQDRTKDNQKTAETKVEVSTKEEKPNHGSNGDYPNATSDQAKEEEKKKEAAALAGDSNALLSRIRSVTQAHLST
jgi:hypothetical protein